MTPTTPAPARSPVDGLRPVITTAEEHRLIQWFPGTRVRVLLDGVTTGGQLSAVEITTEQPYTTPVHVHHGDDEVFLVLEGEIRVWAGDRSYDAGPGGCAFLPRETPHAYAVTSPSARLIGMTTSAALPKLFADAGWDLSAPLPTDWVLTPAAVAAASARLGHEILGPPPAPTAATLPTPHPPMENR